VEFLGYVLVKDCIWAILEFFYEEFKCGFLGFWFSKRENGRMMELFEVR